MLPWIRKFNYITDFFSTAYNLYASLYKAYPVTYYSLDLEESVWEDKEFLGGSYEKIGVGNLSGVKWKKIFMFPVFGIDPVQPMQSSSERGGISYFESMVTNIVFPSFDDMKPLEWDIVDINFGFENNSVKIKPIFVVSSINLVHQGEDYNLHQCVLKVAPFDLTQVENQISSYHMFIEHEKKIYPYDSAVFMLNMIDRSDSLSDNLYNLYNLNLGFYMGQE